MAKRYELTQKTVYFVDLPESITLLGKVCEGRPVEEVTPAPAPDDGTETWIHYCCTVDGDDWGIYASMGEMDTTKVYFLLMRNGEFIDDGTAPRDRPDEIERLVCELCQTAEEYRKEGTDDQTV